MEHNADTDWFIRENLELHRQLRSTMAFLEKCYRSNRGAKGVTAPTEQEWQDIFDMLREVRPRKNKRGFDLISDVLPFAFMAQLAT
jgi:hypothetical protein